MSISHSDGYAPLPHEYRHWFVGPYNFVQISPACGTNTYQEMCEETFHVSISNGNIDSLWEHL